MKKMRLFAKALTLVLVRPCLKIASLTGPSAKGDNAIDVLELEEFCPLIGVVVDVDGEIVSERGKCVMNVRISSRVNLCNVLLETSTS